MATASVRTVEPPAAPPLTAAAKASAAREAAKKARNGDAAEPASNIPRDTQSDAEAAATIRAWPEPPAEEDFFNWLSQFSSDDWNNIILYVWRTAPTIDRRANGRVTHIGKYVHFVDMERIKLDYGSGGYRIDMCVRNPSGGKTTRLAQHYFQIMDLDYPPRVPPGEWIEAPENEAWKWSKAAIETQAMTGGPGTDPNKVFDTVLTGIERLNQGRGNDGSAVVMAAVLNNMAAMQKYMLESNDPTKQITVLATLIEKMFPQRANTGEDPVTALLKDELAAMRDELKEFRKTASKGIVAQLQELLPVAKLLGFKIPGVAGSKEGTETNWADVTGQVVDKLSDHVPLIIDAIRSRNDGPGQNGVSGFRIPVTARPAATVVEHQAQPAATDPAAAPATAAAPAEGTPPAEGAADVPQITPEKQAYYQEVLNQWGQLIQAVTPFMIDQFKQGNGYQFRDWFLARHGEVRWGALREQVGAQTLCELAQMHTFLKVALAPPEKLLEFLNEFFTTPGEEPAGVTVEE